MGLRLVLSGVRLSRVSCGAVSARRSPSDHRLRSADDRVV